MYKACEQLLFLGSCLLLFNYSASYISVHTVELHSEITFELESFHNEASHSEEEQSLPTKPPRGRQTIRPPQLYDTFTSHTSPPCSAAPHPTTRASYPHSSLLCSYPRKAQTHPTARPWPRRSPPRSVFCPPGCGHRARWRIRRRRCCEQPIMMAWPSMLLPATLGREDACFSRLLRVSYACLFLFFSFLFCSVFFLFA